MKVKVIEIDEAWNEETGEWTGEFTFTVEDESGEFLQGGTAALNNAVLAKEDALEVGDFIEVREEDFS